MINSVIQGDCLEVMKDIPDNSIDAVITDPPYGIGVSHWDTVVDIPAFTAEVKRISKDFYCFFGQMPTVINWINEANNQNMKYREHITWVKRNITPSSRLSRCQESIFIYGDRSQFYETRGPFEDVKIPGILFDVATIEGIQRAYQEAQSIISGKTLKNARGHKRQEVFSRFGNQQIMTRHPPTANYTNVWSFLPPQYSKGRCMSGENHHPTEKPIEIMKRLIEMLVPENGVVLDPFGGSATTAIAAINTNRNYILIEKEIEYFELCKERIAKHSPKDYSVIPDNPTLEKNGQLALF